MEATSVQFTVGKLDAGMAFLITPDHHIIEFPSSILPSGVRAGNIVNITVERNTEQELREREQFMQIQDEILQVYSLTPHCPVISVRSVTQTSITLQWDPIVVYNSDFLGIDVMRDKQKLNINLPIAARICKISGLEVGHRYELFVVLRTSAGKFVSNNVSTETHVLENLTGLYPAFGAFSNDTDVDNLVDLIARIDASYSDDLTAENTHLGPKYDRAQELNIPIVTPEFLKACEMYGKVQSAHSYYCQVAGNKRL